MPSATIRTRSADPPHLEVLYELGAAEDALRRAVEARLPEPMSYTQFEVLRDFLRFGDGASPAEIADRLRMTRGAVTHLLQRLEALEWIRIAGDDRDGRRKQVFMTPEGADRARAAAAALRPGTDRLKTDLNDNYLRDGLAFLRDLRLSLEALSSAGGPRGSSPGRR
ncbi:MAG: MarR family winged helix-turn-helix transcriptional regulator [Phenylobacterium sp.]|jgi:DNA-binding MarR family transcriptional regulator